MKLRRLSESNLATFEARTRAFKEVGSLEIDDLLAIEGSSEAELAVDVDPSKAFANRFELATYLNEILGDMPGIERDVGVWSWLTLLFLPQLAPKDPAGNFTIKDSARYVPDSSFRRFYRHLLLGPFLIFRAHRAEPEITRAVLAGRLDSPGELAEQLASRIELVTNRAIIGASTLLYFDPSRGRLKTGSSGKGPGSPRRLADVVNQFDLTLDMYAMSPEQLVALLPQEFARFKHV